MLQVVETIVAAGAQGLTWSLTAHTAGLPLLILEQVRALFRPLRPAAWVRPRPSRAPAPSVEPPTPAAVPLQAMQFRTATDAGPMLGTKYFLRATFLAWPFAGRVRIDDMEEARTLTASLIPLGPWPVIQLWLETRNEHVRIVTMESRHLFGLGNEFDVLDGLTREPLAVVRKPFAGDWLVYSPTGDLAAVVAKDHSGLGAAEFVVRVGGRPVASFTWSMPRARSADAAAEATVSAPVRRRRRMG